MSLPRLDQWYRTRRPRPTMASISSFNIPRRSRAGASAGVAASTTSSCRSRERRLLLPTPSAGLPGAGIWISAPARSQSAATALRLPIPVCSVAPGRSPRPAAARSCSLAEVATQVARRFWPEPSPWVPAMCCPIPGPSRSAVARLTWALTPTRSVR